VKRTIKPKSKKRFDKAKANKAKARLTNEDHTINLKIKKLT
jgi:RNA binding exosome subunit